MKPTQLREIYEAGWELSAHGYEHTAFSWMPPQNVYPALYEHNRKKEVELPKQVLRSWGFDVRGSIYPYGQKPPTVEQHYLWGRNTSQKVNERDPALITDKFALGGYLPSGEVANTVTQAKGWIDTAVTQDKWLILSFHGVNRLTPTGYALAFSQFQECIDYIASKRTSNGLEVVLFEDVFGYGRDVLTPSPLYAPAEDLPLDYIYYWFDTDEYELHPYPELTYGLNRFSAAGATATPAVFQSDIHKTGGWAPRVTCRGLGDGVGKCVATKDVHYISMQVNPLSGTFALKAVDTDGAQIAGATTATTSGTGWQTLSIETPAAHDPLDLFWELRALDSGTTEFVVDDIVYAEKAPPPEPVTTESLTLPALALVTETDLDPITAPALTLDVLALVEEAEAITAAALVLPALALVEGGGAAKRGPFTLRITAGDSSVRLDVGDEPARIVLEVE